MLQAVILAAGRGSRMGAATNGCPKCLLEVGGGSLLAHQLAALRRAGVGEVLVVVGYRAERVQAALGDTSSTLVNLRYATTDSLYSFALAEKWVRSDLLLLNGDVLFDPAILEVVLRDGPDCLAFDSGSGRSEEDMKVAISAGRVAAISKTLAAAQISGENVGLVYLGSNTARLALAAAGRILSAGRDSGSVVDALTNLPPPLGIRAVDVSGLPWIEIDTPEDLGRAHADVWPAIARRAERNQS